MNLIGSFMEVLESPNQDLVGLKGIVTDETKNMLYIKNKSMPKANNKFAFTNKGETFINSGEKLGKPEER